MTQTSVAPVKAVVYVILANNRRWPADCCPLGERPAMRNDLSSCQLSLHYVSSIAETGSVRVPPRGRSCVEQDISARMSSKGHYWGIFVSHVSRRPRRYPLAAVNRQVRPDERRSKPCASRLHDEVTPWRLMRCVVASGFRETLCRRELAIRAT